MSPRESASREGEVVRHALEGVVDLVRDSGGQAAHRGEPLGMEELPLELAYVGLLCRSCLETRPPAGLLHGERAQQQREAHDREVEGVGRAIAGPDRLREAHHRPFRLGARENERAGRRPPFGADRGRRAHLLLAGRPGPAGARREAAEHGVSRVAQLALARGVRTGLPQGEERGRLDLGLDRDPSRQRAGRIAVREARGEARPAGVDRGSFLPRRSGRDPEHRHSAPTSDVHERAAVGGAYADADNLGVAAQEEEERALRGLAQERGGRRILPRLVEPRDRGRGAEEGQVGPDLGETTLESGRLRSDAEIEGAASLVEGSLSGDADAPEAREIHRGDGGEGDSGEPAGGRAERLHPWGVCSIRTIRKGDRRAGVTRGSARPGPGRRRCCTRGRPGTAS
jgi:hypothetical protein